MQRDLVVVLYIYKTTTRSWPAGRPDHNQQHCYHHAPTVKPEAANAIVSS